MENLQQHIFDTQFWDYGIDSEKADEVLEALKTLDSNPMLMKYVKKCLEQSGVYIQSFFYIQIYYTKYGAISGNLEKTTYIPLNKVFKSYDTAEDYARNYDIDEKKLLNYKFERYTIEEF